MNFRAKFKAKFKRGYHSPLTRLLLILWAMPLIVVATAIAIITAIAVLTYEAVLLAYLSLASWLVSRS